MIFVFWISAFLVIYILVGWPLAVGLLAKFRRRPVTRVFVPRRVSVIIAVHNGERYIGGKLDSIRALDYPKDRLETIVISDGSIDATESIVSSGYPEVHLLRVPQGGKCRALNAGISQAKGEILFLTDVRQALEPDCLRHLIACYADPQVGVVSGELRIRTMEGNAGAENVGLYRRIENWIRTRLGEIDSIFGATGSIYSMRRELAVQMPEEILLDDMYLPLAAFFKGYRLIFEDKAVAWDDPTSIHTEFPRKVRTLAGNYQLLRYYPGLLSPIANRMWIHYLSYKLGRLLLPWFLIALFISSCFLPTPWNFAMLIGQAMMYGIAVLDPAIGETNPLKRISSPAHTFLVMMGAAAVALRVFFVDPRSLWVVTGAKK